MRLQYPFHSRRTVGGLAGALEAGKLEGSWNWLKTKMD
jgi:hypothetical protein